ncbi:protein bicaudal C isoform X3 [Maniola jurtina]|uniref:protein bicaudal C isoform X3 n=1 Tax=Maniola jurtina TaxID=191418 RepID=UPI001E689060|nr:protein bicaudal C isoform X3 [Maniola jurtina]
MASTNFLTAKSRLSEFKNSSDKDTISEASESGTSNSVTSAEDLQKLAVILGLNSVEDVYQERFRVDRRRLEAMLAENLEESQTAQAFFHRVMNETNTLINWPARLKIGARSKKDPHVRIAGRPDDVRLAREKIMQLLDTRSNRVTMKIDVSYTDHSHIIGKGGQTIKRVMEETGCHIHFPDSNRTSAQEKSNQVSIAGEMDRVERARARVRALTPLVFCFELPITTQSQPDINAPYVQQIQEQYKVQVMLRNRPKLHANLLVVKGVQWEVNATMEATTLLMNYMCGQLASQTKVQTTLEISPMHHPVVIGRGAEQLKLIMNGTHTQIMFPDAEDPNIPTLRKSCVTITGQINDVYNARQQLVGSLPLVVIFDVPEASFRADANETERLMSQHNVLITVRPKPKQGITSVVIKGIERCAGDIYEVRRELLGGSEPSVTVEIPESYNIPAGTRAMPNFSPFNPFSPTPVPVNTSPRSQYNLQLLTDLANYNLGSPMYGHGPPTPGGYPAPISPLTMTPPIFPGWIIPSPQPRPGAFHFPGMAANPGPNMYKTQASWNQMSGTADVTSCAQMPHDQRHMMSSSSQASSSGYQSNFTGSSISLDTQNISGTASNVGSPSVSPISNHVSIHSPTASTSNSSTSTDADRTQQDLANIISELPISDRRAVGCEKKTLETLKISPPSEYRKLQAEASKAMQESVGGGYRVPNNRWSGYFFSQTSPGPLNLQENGGMTTPERGWNRSELSRPNIMVTSPPQRASPSTSSHSHTPSPAQSHTPSPAQSHTQSPAQSHTQSPAQSHTQSPAQSLMPSPPKRKPCTYQMLYDLLRDRGLYKYIELFKRHELDLPTFASLNEGDLIEIGVSAFGARKKMLSIMAELRKQPRTFDAPAAPTEVRLLNSPTQYNTAARTQDNW